MSRYLILLFIFSFLSAQDQINTGEGLDTLSTEMPVETSDINETIIDSVSSEDVSTLETMIDTAGTPEVTIETEIPDTVSTNLTELAEISENADSAETVTLIPVEEKPAIIMAEMPVLTDSTMGLEYGYKGYPWGTPNKIMWPALKYMGKPDFTADSSMIVISGTLENVNAKVYYSFSDSGFWKVEIDYDISGLSIEDQVDMFTTVEKNLAENYGKIRSTSRNLSGPHSNRSGYPVVKFKRAYYHSSWSPTPCKIELVLFSLNQTAPADLQIIENRTGFLKLVYYNPDFMIISTDEPAPEKLPTIFELY